VSHLKRKVKGTFMLRRNGRLYKVFTARHMGDNWWTFKCMDIESRVNRVFKYQILGIIEVLESAASITKDPKDVLMIDLDNQGKCKIVTKDQIEKKGNCH
jgi:hypothetical protein